MNETKVTPFPSRAPNVVPFAVVIHCPYAGCQHAVSTPSEGQSVKALSAHIVASHRPILWNEGA